MLIRWNLWEKKGERSSEADCVLDKTQDWVSLEKWEGVAKPRKPDAGSWRVELHMESVRGEYPHAHTEISLWESVIASIKNHFPQLHKIIIFAVIF